MKNLYSYTEIHKWFERIATILIVILCIGTPDVYAEGTKQLAPKADDRVYTAFNDAKHGNFGNYDSKDTERLYIHIQDPANELVYFGFSQFVNSGHTPSNSSGNNVNTWMRIKDPNGIVVWPNVGSHNGEKVPESMITSLEQVKKGPNQVCGSGGYDAFVFYPSSGAGDYYIEFSAAQATNKKRPIYTEWWDITVATKGGSPKAIDGRVYAKQWALVSPRISTYWYDRDFNGKVYSYAESTSYTGGYVTEVDFEDSGFRGARFNLAFNSKGTMNTPDFEVNRRSVEDENRLSPEFKIFLNEPDETVYPSAEGYGQFITGGGSEYPRLFGCDGKYFFRVAVTNNGRIDLLLDFHGSNNKYDPDTRDRIVTTLSNPFPNEEGILIRDIQWDGLDGLGNPVSDVELNSVSCVFDYFLGTFHFPMYDVEHLTRGIIPRTVRPTTPTSYTPKLYWDDSEIQESLPGGQLKVDLTGEKAPSHNWFDYDYGNENSINTYWHSYSSGVVTTLKLEQTRDCALFEPGTISGTVFNDLNRDGVMDAGDLPLMGANVRLYWDKTYNKVIDTDDELIETFITKDLEPLGYNGDLGNFIFEPQIGRQYLIEVSNDPNAITGVNPRSYTVYSSGVEYYDQNFGVAPLAEVSLSVSKSIIQENEESLEIIVDLNYPTLVPVTINLIYSGTAEGIDYNLTPGLNATNSTTIEIPVGESRGVIELSSIKDILNEEDETVYVSISSVINAIENGEQSAIITIIDGDHAIANLIDNDPAANSISENVLADALVHITALATDADGDNITYELVDNADGRFKIDLSTGVVTVADASLIDFETEEFHAIEIEARSSDGSKVSKEFTILITDVDPTEGDTDHAITNLIDTDSDANSISENAKVDDLVHITALATDSDGDVISYYLINDSDGRFQIDLSTGVVTVADASLIDFETEEFHAIEIEARSSDGSTIAENFTIIVTDVDGTGGDTDHDITNLIDSDLDMNIIGELDMNGSIVHLTALATDEDGDVITYHLLDDADGRFSINETSGVVTIADETKIDYETNQSHNVIIEARSTDGSSVSGNFVIQVSDENEDLQAIDDDAIIYEDIVLNGEDLLSNDIKVRGSSLTIRTTPIADVTNGELIIRDDGTYTYTPNLNFNGVDSFVYSVCDNGTPQQCDQATVYITIQAVNDSPIAMNDEAEVYEDETLNGLSVLENDSDVDSDSFEINTSPIEDVDHGILTINTNGTYTYIPDADFNGTDLFTYEICDNETLAACGQATVTISVLPVNDAPRVFDFEMEVKEASLNNPINLESPYDPDGEKLSVKILSTVEFGEVVLASGLILNDNDVISVDNLLDLEFNSRLGYVGELTFVYEVSDESGLSALGRVKIIVTPIDVFIPNAITPNNDSLNDKLKIVGLDKFPENSIEIFNRWGNIVYKKHSYDNNWEGYGNVSGQISNERLPPGTYFYVFKFGVNKQPLTGYVYMTY